MTLQIGLTGNMGSGKTTVAKIFETLGAPVFYADIEAKKLYCKTDIQKSLLNIFGNSVFQNNQLSLKLLSSLVFSDTNKLNQLTELIHPLVKTNYLQWFEKQKNCPYVIMENAVLLEGGFETYCDYIITVTALEKLRIERIQKRDGLSLEDIYTRFSKQMDENLKVKISDFVIDNNKDKAILPQIMNIHEFFLQTTIIS
jgi:dephospho-CoA kinase